jgi:organic hydroperoxide reductase OsmC/OhrA
VTAHPFPHRYSVRAGGKVEGLITVEGDKLQAIRTSAPPLFGGPEGNWSPESLLVAAVADCFVLSFRAVARASSLAWRELEVSAEGVLDKAEGGPRFTRFTLDAKLVLAEGATESLAETALLKAKRSCLVTNSLKAECELKTRLVQPPGA